jgi:hypothetical protein
MKSRGSMHTPIMGDAECVGGPSSVDPNPVDPSRAGQDLACDSEPGITWELPLAQAEIPAWFMPARFVDPSASGFDELGATGAAT